MLKPRRVVLFVLLLVAASSALAALLAAPSGGSLDEADRFYEERSYAKALPGYEQSLAAGTAGGRQTEIEYRVAVCLGRSDRWDEALEATQAFITAHPDGIWGARGNYWLGQLLTFAPHQGYRVGKKLYRGSDYPNVAVAEKPQQVYLYQQDADAALAAFEQAKRLYEQVRPREEREETELNFDLAQVLGSRDLMSMAQSLAALAREKHPSFKLQLGEPDPAEMEKLRNHDWTLTPGQLYDATQPIPQRILGLYEQIEQLDGGKRAPQARLARAIYLRAYQAQMRNLMRLYNPDKKEWLNLSFPYDKLSPLDILRSIPRDYPHHAIAPQAQFLVGNWFEAQAEFIDALAVYRELIDRWPQSKWVSDAQDRIQDIEWPSLQLVARPTRPGQKAVIDFNGRNVKTVTFAAYRVRLDKLLLEPRTLHNPRRRWADWSSYAADSRAGAHAGTRVATWTHLTTDSGEHAWLREQVTAPLTKVGAYVVEARSGEAHAAALLIVTDLAIVQRSDKDRTTAFVCDAKSGQPVPGADVVIREIYTKGDDHFVSIERGQSNPDGLRSKALTRGPDIRGNQLEVLAWVGERYAVTGPAEGYGYWRDNRDEYRAYTYTDRPVYRPGQRVNFRAVLTVREVGSEDGQPKGEYKPLVSTPIAITVRDPRHQKVHDATLTTNEFGSVNGTVGLDAEAALGEYTIEIRVPASGRSVSEAGGNRFRVEEYKKPEFEVTVTPAAEHLRLGGQMKGIIKARYYLGSPVVGARVKYRVFRQPYYPAFRFPHRYDWLIRYWREGDYGYRYPGSGDVVLDSEGRTNADGELRVEFETESGGRSPQARAYTYIISAEVTDESRRTITGSGEVRASAQQFFAFLDVKHGFYQAGDRVEVELATRDVMDRPIAARGRMRVERVVKGASNLVEAVVHEEGIATDKAGRALFRWVPKVAGQYRFTFAATDEWKQEITTSTYRWVCGAEFRTAAFRLRGIELVPEKDTYEEGETCKLLIVSSLPDATVVLTQEAGNQILARLVVRMKGKSHIVQLPIRRTHVPNFYVHAVAVREWQAYETSAEMFVPPAKQFLNVSVTSDRSEYRPGEKAAFRIKATDWRGRPAKAELSVGVVDASLFYIQKDYAPDPRIFFYGERRYLNVAQVWSLQWRPRGVWSTDRTRQPHKRHEWIMPEGMGRLRDWPEASRIYWLREGGAMYEITEERLGQAVDSHRFRPLNALVTAGAYPNGGAYPVPKPPPAQASALKSGATVAAMPAPGPAGRTGPGGELAAATVRTRFADTAYWSPAIVTNNDGTATVTVTMPENLTTWRAVARGFTTEVQVGSGSVETVTRKNLIVRLQAPRFFMERDLVALSANVHNYLKSEKKVKVALALDGGTLELVKDVPAAVNLGQAVTDTSLWVTVPKDGEQRVDWVVRVLRSGTAKVRMTAQTDEESDAVEMEFPALVHGVEKFVAQSGVARDIKGSQDISLRIDVPKERRQGATELNVQLTPSLAAIALDALPYLADYPYGCIEQTMSRFLPTVAVARTLTDLGIDLDELRQRADAYAREHEVPAGGKQQPDSAYTYPKGAPGSMNAAEMAGRMYMRRVPGPVFDRKQLDAMVRAGLERIYSMQRSDGGWGWWPSDVSDPYMTAYVCYGLFTAREAGRDIDDDALERGFIYLVQDLKDDDNLHRLAYIASVVTLRGAVPDEVKTAIADRLYRNRMKLTPYSQALLALALKQIGQVDQARVILDNLENTANIDRDNGTCNWRPRQRGWWWWHWWDSPVETNAAVLRAYIAIRPDDELAPMIVKWMVNNRRGNHWSSTKETAMAVYALADYIRVKKELAPDYTITVDLDGKVQRTYKVNRENALFFDNRFIVGDEVIGDGAQTLTISVKGSGTLYYSAYLQYFSLEEDIKGVGNEIFVQRRYFKLTPHLVTKQEKGQTWQELAYDRAELASGAQLASGDLIEVELVVDSKNDYEYVVFEDMKPAGCEPVEVRSGYAAGEGAGVWPYVELRDEKVAMFVSGLPQGRRAMRYRLRAEIPGMFHALPTNGYSMYAPDVRCLSDEWRVGIGD